MSDPDPPSLSPLIAGSAAKSPSAITYVVIATSIICALAVTSSFEVAEENHWYVDRTRTAAHDTAKLLEGYLAQSFDAADTALKNVEAEYAAELSRGLIDARTFNAFLVRQKSYHPQFDALRATDEKGDVVFGDGLPQDRTVNISDREFFRVLRDGTATGLVVAPPMSGKIRTEMMIPFTRALHSRDGAFAGTTSVLITTDTIRTAFSDLRLGPSAAVSIRTGSLDVLFRHPDPADGARQTPSFDVPEAVRDAIRQHPDSGELIATAPSDGFERFTAYRRILNYPFYVFVELPTEGEGWRAHLGLVSGVAGLGALVTILSALVMYRGARSRARIREDLAAEAFKVRTLLRNAGDGLHVLDRNGNLVEVSESFVEMLGYPRETLLRMNVTDWDAGIPAADLKAKIASVRDARTVLETVHRRADGTLRDVEIISNRVEIASQALLYCSARDITERKQQQALLAASEERFHAMADSAPALLWICDARMQRTFVNKGWEDFTGHPLERALGDGWLDEIHPDDRQRCEEVYARAMTARSPFTVDCRIHQRNDGYRWFVDRGVPVFAGDGSLEAYYGSCTDVDELRSSGLLLGASNRQLAETIADLRQRQQELTLVARMNDQLPICETEAEIFGVVETIMNSQPEIGSGSVAIGRANGTQMEVVARWGGEMAVAPGFDAKDCWALRRGTVHSTRDPSHDVLCRHFLHHPGDSTICIPLLVKGEVLGVITRFAGDATPGWDEDSAQRLVATVGDVLKLAVSNLRLRESLREQATHDPLTGLYNRSVLDGTLERELHRCDRKASRLCVAMLDLDHFKRYNDEHGHEAGDFVLRRFSELIGHRLRRSDFACRYGGEEFLLVLPDADIAQSFALMDGLREDVKRSSLVLNGVELPAPSVSVGLAEYPAHGTDVDSIIKCADAALYAAKDAGRDCVRAFQSDVSAGSTSVNPEMATADPA